MLLVVTALMRLLLAVKQDGVHRTRDLGGTSSSSQFLKAVLDAL